MNGGKIAAAMLSTALFFGTSAYAQAWERVLVPVVIEEPVSGAYGSVWRTDLIGRNESDAEAIVDDGWWRACGQGCPNKVASHSTFRFAFALSTEQGAPSLLWISTPHNEQVTFNLRVQDVSRQSLTWGTELPVVREKEFVSGRSITLLNVPTDSRFRQTLRVFDIDRKNIGVRLRAFDIDGETPIVDEVLQFGFPQGEADPAIPGRIQLNLVDAYPALRNVETVRIVITPLTDALKFWAFVSITNNETQHVTTITPQQ